MYYILYTTPNKNMSMSMSMSNVLSHDSDLCNNHENNNGRKKYECSYI